MAGLQLPGLDCFEGGEEVAGFLPGYDPGA